MKKLLIFVITLVKQANDDDVISITNDLTYKIILSLFPLIIFMLSVLGFFALDATELSEQLKTTVPEALLSFLSYFIDEVSTFTSTGLLSGSLLVTLFSASSGFSSLMIAVNKAYGVKDTRNFIKKKIISLMLVLVFVFMIVLSLVMLIFNNSIYNVVLAYFPNTVFMEYLFSLLGYTITIGAMLVGVMIMNKLSLSKKLKFKNILPGSLFTVLIWLIASKIFNIYVNNFSKYSSVYGGVAGIMILMIWINIICLVLIMGSEINALLEVE